MTWRALLLGLLLLTALPTPAAAPATVAADPRVADAVRLWSEWVEYQAALAGVPGLSAGIVHDQELIATRAFGLADPAAGRPATVATLYSICSISKLFTSIAVLRERDAGRLRLDDPVAQHLDWFAIQDAHPDDEPITIRGLLTHSAGLPRESAASYWTDPGYPFPTRAQLRDQLAAQRTLYPAARFFQYSNLGMALAGEIVAATSGMPFERYVTEQILLPLGMRATLTDVPPGNQGLAVGHGERRRDGTRAVLGPFSTLALAPAAGLVSNVVDLARFLIWQNRLLGGASAGDGVLRAASLREMQRVHWVDPDWNTTWGLGFAIQHEGERTLVTHGGGCPGYYSHLRLEPRTRLGAVVLANAIGAETALYTAGALDLVGPAVALALDPEHHPAPLRDDTLERFAGVYDSEWSQLAVAPWEDGLALLALGEREPAAALLRLRRSDDPLAFTVVRRDDPDVPGDVVRFEAGADGTIVRLVRHGSRWVRFR